jgi:DNA-binding transcriptional LysR family regulator
MSPDTRLLRYFLAVAQDLHFGRAAARLHVSQPSVSRGVRALEEMIGTPLFVRAGRSVHLTPAGDVLLEQAPRALEGLTRALKMSREAAQGQRGNLSLSFLPSARPLVLEAVRRYHERFEAVHLSLEEGLDEFQYHGLETGRFDLGIVRGYRPLPQLMLENLVDARLCVALSVTHRLATAPDLGYEDLAEENFILWPRVGSPDGFDRIVSGCRRAGYEPRVAAETSNAQTVIALVAAGVGVSILGSTLGGFEDSRVTFVPLRGELDRLYVVRRANDDSSVCRDFVAILLACGSTAPAPAAARPDRRPGSQGSPRPVA